MDNDATVWIFAYEYKGEYVPEELLLNDLDKQKCLDDLEYSDVVNAEYQIWKYPSGEIFNVESDRQVPVGGLYSTPNTVKGVVWLPKLVKVGVDKEKVASAFKVFNA